MRIFLLLLMFTSVYADTHSLDPNMTFLPTRFPVYVKDDVILNYPARGFTKKYLPTVNKFKGKPGCYIACYSNEVGVYQVSDSIYVHGMVRIPGHYDEMQCLPNGKKTILAEIESLKQLCHDEIETCDTLSSCWAGGDTQGWFNLRPQKKS